MCAERIWRYFGCVHYKCLLDFQEEMATSSCPPEYGIQKYNEDRHNVDRVCHYRDGDVG